MLALRLLIKTNKYVFISELDYVQKREAQAARVYGHRKRSHAGGAALSRWSVSLSFAFWLQFAEEKYITYIKINQ